MSLPCSLLSASTLGLSAMVSPLRARPLVGLRCHIGHLAEAPLDPRDPRAREELGARADCIRFVLLVLVTTLAEKVRGLPSPCLVFGLAPYSAGEKARCALW